MLICIFIFFKALLEGVVYVYQDLIVVMKPVHKDHIEHLYTQNAPTAAYLRWESLNQ
jgi:hypothetical protein